MIAAGDPEWAVHYASDEPTPSPVNRLKKTTYHHAGSVISCVELKGGFLTAAQTIVFIHAVHRKNVLGEINSNRDNSHDFLLLLVVVLMKYGNSILALLMPFAVTSPQPRDGEVPFIRYEAI